MIDKFLARVTKTPGCWLWTGPVDRDGYGEWQYDYKRTRAHRWSYQLFIGPIPVNTLVCHRCDVPACVNPEHLFLGTQADNMHDMVNKGRKAPKTGEHHHMCKLTNDIVRRLRAADDGKRGTAVRLAREFGFSYQTVSDILRHRRWKHVP